MALGVDGMRAGKVVRKTIFLTLGTPGFIFCLTLVYQSMRAVMDVGGVVRVGWRRTRSARPCPKGVGVGDAGGDLRHALRRHLHLPRRRSPRAGRGPTCSRGRRCSSRWAGTSSTTASIAPGGGTAVGLAGLRVRVRRHGRRAAPLPPVAADRALVALGPELPTGRRLPPPVQATTPAAKPRRSRPPRPRPCPRARRTPRPHRARTWSPVPGSPASTVDLPDPVADVVVPDGRAEHPEGQRGRAAGDARRPARDAGCSTTTSTNRPRRGPAARRNGHDHTDPRRAPGPAGRRDRDRHLARHRRVARRVLTIRSE